MQSAFSLFAPSLNFCKTVVHHQLGAPRIYYFFSFLPLEESGFCYLGMWMLLALPAVLQPFVAFCLKFQGGNCKNILQ